MAVSLGVVTMYLPILRRHGFDTSADTNVNHPALDGVGYVNACLQARGALSVQAPDTDGIWKASGESSGAELGSTTAGRQNSTDRDILDQARVNLGTLDQCLEGADQQIRGSSVLEAALAALCEGCPESASDDNIIRRLFQYIALAWEVYLRGRQVRCDLIESGLC